MSLGKKEKITGVVVVQKICIGSKSEHDAIVLQSGNGPDLEIRVKNGNPFALDKSLQPFIGMRVTLEGVRASGRPAVLVDSAADIQVLGPPGRPKQPGKPPQP